MSTSTIYRQIMFILETELAARMLGEQFRDQVVDPNVVFDEESKKFYLVFKRLVGEKKDGEPKLRVYKKNITRWVNAHGGLTNLFANFVAAKMILEGYMIVPIENGWLCVGGDEVYSLTVDSCTCQAFVTDPTKPCKHMQFKEAVYKQRSRLNKWKQDNLK